MLMLPRVWNCFWKGSTTMRTVAVDGRRGDTGTLDLVKEELPTFAAVNMPLTAKAGESMAGMGGGRGWEKVGGVDGGEEEGRMVWGGREW